MDAIDRLFRGDPSGLDRKLTDPGGKTPNQRALACAIALSAARLGSFDKATAIRQCRDLFAAMQENGHQAVGPTYGSEQGAPDPHAELWAAPLAMILREARLQVISDLLDSALGYWGDHIAMCEAFWTTSGVRIPGSRAKDSGMELRPNWTVDSRIYADVTSTPLKKEPTAWDTVNIMRDSRSLWPEIVKRAARARVKLAVPLLKWNSSAGGFVGCLDHDVPMNDRLSWLIVDGAGAILNASHNLDDFVRPPGPPDLVFGGEQTAQDAPERDETPLADEAPASGADGSPGEPPALLPPAKKKRRWWEFF